MPSAKYRHAMPKAKSKKHRTCGIRFCARNDLKSNQCAHKCHHGNPCKYYEVNSAPDREIFWRAPECTECFFELYETAHPSLTGEPLHQLFRASDLVTDDEAG